MIMRKSPLQQLSENYRADPNRPKQSAKWTWGGLWSLLDLISLFGRLFG
jgi:hypothetical protein